jgi:acyl-CoA thioester hydrolase
MRWPGEVAIGTAVTRLGRSSMTLGQGIFVDGACVATAHTVIVLMNEETRKSRPFPDETREALMRLAPAGASGAV